MGGAQDCYPGEMVCFISVKYERAMRETRHRLAMVETFIEQTGVFSTPVCDWCTLADDGLLYKREA